MSCVFHAGLNISLCPMYLAEISPRKIRGAIGTCHQLAITIGILIAQIFGLSEIFGNYKHRVMFILCEAEMCSYFMKADMCLYCAKAEICSYYVKKRCVILCEGRYVFILCVDRDVFVMCEYRDETSKGIHKFRCFANINVCSCRYNFLIIILILTA